MTRYMTVIKINEDNSKSLEEINLLDVDFLESVKNELIYYIGGQKYYQITKKSQFEEFLRDEGFDSLDRPNFVNLKKIRNFDEKFGKVYFEENPNQNSIYATVAKIKYEFCKKIINRVVSHNNKTTQVNTVVTKDIRTKLKGLLG